MKTILFSIMWLSIGWSNPTFTNPNSNIILPPFSIVWPDNFTILVTDENQIESMINPANLVPPYDKPLVYGCDGYYVSYQDTHYTFNICRKYLRTWTVECGPKTFTHVQIIKVIVKDGPIEPCGTI